MGILDTPVFLVLKHITWICVQRHIYMLCFREKVGSRKTHFRALLAFPQPFPWHLLVFPWHLQSFLILSLKTVHFPLLLSSTTWKLAQPRNIIGQKNFNGVTVRGRKVVRKYIIGMSWGRELKPGKDFIILVTETDNERENQNHNLLWIQILICSNSCLQSHYVTEFDLMVLFFSFIKIIKLMPIPCNKIKWNRSLKNVKPP